MCTEEANLAYLYLKLPLNFKRSQPVSVVTQPLSELHQTCQHFAIHLSENCMNVVSPLGSTIVEPEK